MFDHFYPITAKELLEKIKSYPNQRGFAIMPELSWFDRTHNVPQAAECGYPFHIGIWAREFAKKLVKARDNGFDTLTLDLVFTYVVGVKHYRGLIRYDLPMKMEISVRVTEQRHLKITPDTVVLASISDDTEFATWRPVPTIETDPTGTLIHPWVWIQQKSLTTSNIYPHYAFCPTELGDVPSTFYLMMTSLYTSYFKAAFTDQRKTDPTAMKVIDDYKRIYDHMRNIIHSRDLRYEETPNEIANAYRECYRLLRRLFDKWTATERDPELDNSKEYELVTSRATQPFYDFFLEYTKNMKPH